MGAGQLAVKKQRVLINQTNNILKNSLYIIRIVNENEYERRINPTASKQTDKQTNEQKKNKLISLDTLNFLPDFIPLPRREKKAAKF